MISRCVQSVNSSATPSILTVEGLHPNYAHSTHIDLINGQRTRVYIFMNLLEIYLDMIVLDRMLSNKYINQTR